MSQGLGAQLKGIEVRMDPKTSLFEAGVWPLDIPDDSSVVACSNLLFPSHDRNLTDLFLKHLNRTRPAVIFVLGRGSDENSWRDLLGNREKDKIVHKFGEAPEVAKARKAKGFEKQVMTLGKTFGQFFIKMVKAAGPDCLMIYIPTLTTQGIRNNEHRIIEAVLREKDRRDNWGSKHLDASESVSDPLVRLPMNLDELFLMNEHPQIQVLPLNAGVLVNGHTLCGIIDYKRRRPGDASAIEWEQSGYNILGMADGKLASSWLTTPDDSMPGHNLNFWQYHEVPHMSHPVYTAWKRTYDQRASGFWSGRIVKGQLFGQSFPFIRGNDMRRSIVVDGVVYTEKEPGGLPNGSPICLAIDERKKLFAKKLPVGASKKKSNESKRKKR